VAQAGSLQQSRVRNGRLSHLVCRLFRLYLSASDFAKFNRSHAYVDTQDLLASLYGPRRATPQPVTVRGNFASSSHSLVDTTVDLNRSDAANAVTKTSYKNKERSEAQAGSTRI